MKADLEKFMARENVDMIWAWGSVKYNPVMTYLVGKGHISEADLILKRGEDPVLICGPMEREEAEATGLPVKLYSDYHYQDLFQKHAGDTSAAMAELKMEILKDHGINQGRVSVYGSYEISRSWPVLKKLEELLPEVDFLGEGAHSILLEARATKDLQEVERIRNMGQLTTEVVGKVADYLTSREVDEGEGLVEQDGTAVTVGKVKQKIRLWLAERGGETPEGTIFAQGRDAGIPHSAGTETDQIRLGKTIIFDIFPQEAGGGYFFDFTRTWCLGYAPEEEQELYDHVAQVYRKIMTDLKLGETCSTYQEKTCQYFEDLGHATIRQDGRIQSGYVHSLGHGLGLSVHEHPRFGRGSTEADILAAGSVVTIEPGLYYPERGMGCRLEDTVWVRDDGRMEVLVDYPRDLVLPMKNWQA